jgi:hypothetical protein
VGDAIADIIKKVHATGTHPALDSEASHHLHHTAWLPHHPRGLQ